MAPWTSAAAQQAAPVAHLSGSATYYGRLGHATRLEVSADGLLHALRSEVTPPAEGLARGGIRVIPFRSPAEPYPASKATGGGAPSVGSGTLAGRAVAASTVTVVQAFNGLSDVDSANANGVHVTPPAQGLCVGTFQGQKVVWELNNQVSAIYSPSGTLLAGPVSLDQLFGEAPSQSTGEPRCVYDPATQTFFFTEGARNGSGAGPTHTDVLAVSATGIAHEIAIDTSLGSLTCIGDQPKVGFDNNALIVSTDEFCGPSQTTYMGAFVVAISRAQLVTGAATVNSAAFGPLSLAGIPVTGLDPAINTGTGTSYLVSSFPYNAAGNNNALSKSLGFWTVTGDAALATGGTPTLTGKVIGSERYAFPVPALSTGDGTTPAGQPSSVINEPSLSPDDSRLSGPVNVTHDDDGVAQLWTALDSAVLVTGSPAAVDGAAWFKIDTGTHRVVRQGYVSATGANLLYPAVLAPPAGPPAMVFSITSPTLNPSAAYTTLRSGKVTVVGAGAGPHWSDVTFNEPRWGDYSWAAIDPGTNGIWLATEYVPPTTPQTAIDNWGTYIFQLSN
jgi:hypothetical protein